MGRAPTDGRPCALAGTQELAAAALRAVVEASPGAVGVWDELGELVLASPALLSLVDELGGAALEAPAAGLCDELAVPGGRRLQRRVVSARAGDRELRVVHLEPIDESRADEAPSAVAGRPGELASALGAIAASLGSLLDGAAAGPDARRRLRVAEWRLRRLARLAGLRTGPVTALATAPLDLRVLLFEAVESAAPGARAAGVTLQLRCEEPLGCLADPARLRLAIDALIESALASTPLGGSAEVRAQRRGAVAEVEVSDDGVGLAPDEASQAFSASFRPALARELGIPVAAGGLALARAVVEAHGGSVRLLGDAGRGTTVRVELPLRPSSAGAA
jgi:signal transduction histidine kinase